MNILLTITFFMTFQPSPASEIHSIIQAVDKLSTKEELVADGSRDYSLPTIQGKHSDLKTISSETVLKCFVDLLFPAESG